MDNDSDTAHNSSVASDPRADCRRPRTPSASATPGHAAKRPRFLASSNDSFLGESKSLIGQEGLPDMSRGGGRCIGLDSGGSVIVNNIKKEILPYVNFVMFDDRQGEAEKLNPWRDMICSLLCDPGSFGCYPNHELLPAEISWERFIDIAGHFEYDTQETVFYATLSRDKQVIASGTMGHSGEFTRAISVMNALIGKAVNGREQGGRFSIAWALRDGNPYFDIYNQFAEGEVLGRASCDQV